MATRESQAKKRARMVARITNAARELNDAVRATWEDNDDVAVLRLAYADLADKLTRADTMGLEIDGWEGNQLNHADTINAVMGLIECYVDKNQLISG